MYRLLNMYFFISTNVIESQHQIRIIYLLKKKKIPHMSGTKLFKIIQFNMY